jgi:hypothetical protein
MRLDEADPKGLIREAYRIEGISAAECRSVLVDWALSLPADADYRDALSTVIAAHAGDAGHPMTAVLHEGLKPGPAPGRRGGRAARMRGR